MMQTAELLYHVLRVSALIIETCTSKNLHHYNSVSVSVLAALNFCCCRLEAPCFANTCRN